MEIIRYLRQLRRHWKLILVVSLLGLGVGLLAANRASDRSTDEADVVVYYDVRHTLIVNEANSAGVNLSQAAFFATIGQVPQAVADRVGGEPVSLAASVQTLTNTTLRTIVLSAVADTSEAATEVTNAFAEELVAFLQGDQLVIYQDSLATANTAVLTASADIVEVDTILETLRAEAGRIEIQLANVEIAGQDALIGQEAQIAELDGQLAAVQSEIGDQERARTAIQARLDLAIVNEDAVVAQGPPTPPMLTLDVSVPSVVTQRERDRRLAAGREGTANYSQIADLPTGSGGGISSSLLDSPTALVLAGILGGALTGVALALAWARLDHRLLDKEEAEEYFGLPVIAEIPKIRRSFRKKPIIISHTEPMSQIAEAYRSLRSSLMYVRDFGDEENENGDPADSQPATVILITSPGAAEGKTSTVANLATVLAEEGYSVLTINCDFRRPRLAFFMGGEHEPRRVSATDVDGVSLINHVTADGADARPSDALREQKRVIESARDRFDVILLDTAPMLATNDAAEVLPLCDLVLVVARTGQTTKESAEATREILERRQAPVAGVVLVGSESAASAPGYYYYYNDRKGAKWRFSALRSRRRRDEKHLAKQQDVVEFDDSDEFGEPVDAEA